MPSNNLGLPAEARSGGDSIPEAASSTIFFHELSLEPHNIRNPEVQNFFARHNFMPYYWREITVANKKLGLADALFEARFSHNNVNNPPENQIRAAEKTYEGAEKYADKSAKTLSVLRSAFSEEEISPSPQEIKRNPQILDAIAQFILAFRKVEAGYWPAWNAEVLSSALEQIKSRLAQVSDEEAVALWNMVRVSDNERMKFWNNQIRAVKDNKIVQEINGLRESRRQDQPIQHPLDGKIVEYDGMAEAGEPIAPEEEKTEERSIWEGYVPPNGQVRIEGTDQLPLVTNMPVTRLPKREQAKAQAQPETLFQVPQTPKDIAKPAASLHPRPPYRARFSDTTDYSMRALREGLEEETAPAASPNPDADLDEIFGPAAKK